MRKKEIVHPAYLRTVMINCAEYSYRGIIFERRAPWLVLRNVTVFREGSAPVEVDGEVVVDERKVDFIQVLGSE